jgi:CheY-like chemotaxis protein
MMKNLSRLKDQAESATKAKSDFLSNMSHEIRTPMNAVIGFGELLRNTNLDITQKDYVETICGSGELLLSLINDILDISKIESQKVSLEEIDFDLEYLIESCLKLLRQRIKGKSLDLNMAYQETIPRFLKGDPTRIRQILINLVGNAIKFTDEGAVTVAVRSGNEKTTSTDKAVALELSIKDTGIGIPPEKQNAIFEAFTQVDASITRKYGGTGLGLTITQSLVRLMSGTIRVQSEEGKGSEFIINVSLKKGSPTGESKITLIDIEGLKGKKAIIVDDNAQSREILANYCSSAGITAVHSVGSAKMALEWLGNPANKADMLLSDIMMPGTDGYTLCKEIRNNENMKSMVTIALTSDALPGSADKTREAGFDAYLSKPFTRHDFYTILQAVFGDSRKGDRRIITRHMVQEILTKGVSVLVVEDNPLNQKLMGILLKQMDCVVEMAANGKEAIAMVEKKKYDLILMDIQMPVMDGYQATEHIRMKLKLTTPVIALTAKVFQEDQEKCLSYGMNDFLAKPVETKALKAMIIKWGRK